MYLRLFSVYVSADERLKSKKKEKKIAFKYVIILLRYYYCCQIKIK